MAVEFISNGDIRGFYFTPEEEEKLILSKHTFSIEKPDDSVEGCYIIPEDAADRKAVIVQLQKIGIRILPLVLTF